MLGVWFGAAWIAPAAAEGTAQTGVVLELQADVPLFVDVLVAGETIRWSGRVADPLGGPDVDVALSLTDPAGVPFGVLPSGAESPPLTPGAWSAEILGVDLDVDGLDERVIDWDLAVPGAAEGRVWSTTWEFDSNSFTIASAFDGSFYGLVDGGAPGESSVVELRADGLVGKVFFVKANDLGVLFFPGRSVPLGALDPDGNEALSRAEFPIYLQPPELATWSARVPDVTNLSFVPRGTCEGVVPEVYDGNITFDANVSGIAHLVCDLDRDGVFDFTADLDLHRRDQVEAGPGVLPWDGTDEDDLPVPPGTYDCELILTLGEFHFVANDVETSYEGLRLFEVTDLFTGPDRDRVGLSMYWNDALIQPSDVAMPNGELGLVTSGPAGLFAGDYADAAIPNVNARSWGNFTELGKGNDALADTYGWVRDDREAVQVVVVDPALDSDGDGLFDWEEDCRHRTDPTLPDTDGDGLDDRFEVQVSESDPLDADTDDDGLGDAIEAPPGDPLRDTDADGEPDWDDPDDDGDLVPTLAEDWDGSGDWSDDDTDLDTVPGWLDADDDGDGVAVEPTLPSRNQEDADRDGDPADDDTDGDSVPNALDPDDDGDGVPSLDEADADGDGVVDDADDTDGDGLQDFLDPDDDDDGVDTADELDGDTDGDDLPDRLDDDDDGDGIDTRTEGAGDTDGDGAPDYLDEDSDADGLTDLAEGLADTDGDGAPDRLDTDDDDDRVPSAEEGPRGDTDADGVPDARDTDDDGDGIPTAVDGTTDPDDDGVPNFLDLDSDDDTLQDLDEGTLDPDLDGKGAWLDPDDDGDGIDTRVEIEDAVEPGEDPDGDGVPSWEDEDSDGDELTDEEEGRTDFDRDGLPDYLDPDPNLAGYYRGGCDTGGALPAPLLGLALCALLVRRRGRRLAAAGLLAAPVAAAQDPAPGGFDAHGFVLSAYRPDVRDALAVQRPAAFDAGDWFAGGLFEYAKDPLVFVVTDAAGVEELEVRHALDNVFALDASFGVAAHERLRFDLAVPLFFTSSADGAGQGAGLGDLRLAAMVVAARPDVGRVPGFALVPFVDLPAGDAGEFLGSGGVAGGGRLATTWEAPGYTLSADAGLHFQRGATVENLDASDAFTAGAAVGLLPSERVGVTLEGRLSAPFQGSSTLGEPGGTGTPAEILLSTRYVGDTGGLFTGGVGLPLSHGAGAAAFRLFVGGGFGAVPTRDTDADGIVGDLDLCPEVPETQNGFRDGDGCPDGPSPVVIRVLGPDGAPVRDAALALTTAAGAEQLALPDGTLERAAFPGEAFTARATGRCLAGEASGQVPEDGGLTLDVPLAAVYSARVLFVAEDEAGAPMPGLTVSWTTSDGCVAAPSFAFDGYADVPVGPGTYGVTIQAAAGGFLPVQQTVEAFDGKVTDVYVQLRPTMVRLEAKRIVILDKVFFETGKAVILPQSFKLLDDVAATITANPQVGRVEVGGHTDAQGPDAKNLELSRSRAESVLLYLAQQGVDAARLLAVGYGEARPIASNKTKAGMAENRRVEFQLVDQAPEPTP